MPKKRHRRAELGYWSCRCSLKKMPTTRVMIKAKVEGARIEVAALGLLMML